MDEKNLSENYLTDISFYGTINNVIWRNACDGKNMAGVVKWLTRRIVAPLLEGSIPSSHPIIIRFLSLGRSQVGKARDFDSRTVGSNPATPARFDPLAQSVEHLTFNQVVRGSNPRCFTRTSLGLFFIYADVAELADALDLGSSGRPCRFDSCHPQYRSRDS